MGDNGEHHSKKKKKHKLLNILQQEEDKSEKKIDKKKKKVDDASVDFLLTDFWLNPKPQAKWIENEADPTVDLTNGIDHQAEEVGEKKKKKKKKMKKSEDEFEPESEPVKKKSKKEKRPKSEDIPEVQPEPETENVEKQNEDIPEVQTEPVKKKSKKEKKQKISIDLTEDQLDLDFSTSEPIVEDDIDNKAKKKKKKKKKHKLEEEDENGYKSCSPSFSQAPIELDLSEPNQPELDSFQTPRKPKKKRKKINSPIRIKSDNDSTASSTLTMDVYEELSPEVKKDKWIKPDFTDAKEKSPEQPKPPRNKWIEPDFPDTEERPEKPKTPKNTWKKTDSKGIQSNVRKLSPELREMINLNTFNIAEYDYTRQPDLIAKLGTLSVDIPFFVPQLHLIETGIATCSKRQQARLKSLGIPLKKGPFSKAEDEKIMANWKHFCELHDFDPSDPRPFLRFTVEGERVIPPIERLRFGRFLAHGLDDRPMSSTYQRFVTLNRSRLIKGGRFNESEDRIILEYCEQNVSTTPFYDLAGILNRHRRAILKRYEHLKRAEHCAQREIITWNDDRITEFVLNLLIVTGKTKSEELNGVVLTSEHWKKLSERMKGIPERKLRMAWTCTISSRVLCGERRIDYDKILFKLVRIMRERKEDDWRTVIWKDIVAEHFPGLGPFFLYRLLRHAIDAKVPEKDQKDLGAALGYLADIETVTGIVKPRIEVDLEYAD